ncbi:hypothetical protein ACFGVS_21035 [Mucilaginibacter sp. AW1-7]|jgi:hypothetical protein|uniref:hypothetical protein n=1 Tax=Mucilaginibacter sp. AW1-7 TaxID=3349874 RepID=UPI003F73B439
MSTRKSSGGESFNDDFCSSLEYHLSRAFNNSCDSKLRWFWCDGVEQPSNEGELTWELINQSRKIETKAWIGATGQDVYNMTIKLDLESLSRCAEGQSLKGCLPDEHSFEWVTIDVDLMTILLQLK